MPMQRLCLNHFRNFETWELGKQTGGRFGMFSGKSQIMSKESLREEKFLLLESKMSKCSRW